MQIKFFKCEHCGNIAVKVVDAGVPMVCCGEKMVELVAGSVDAASRSTFPRSPSRATRFVEVGASSHDGEHLIEFMCLVTERLPGPLCRPGRCAHADFVVAEGDACLAVYEHCNLHGLWVAEL